MLLHRRGRHLKARRAGRLVALGAAVLGVHLWLVATYGPSRLGEGAADGGLARFEVAFVNELQPAVPPAGAARPATPEPRSLVRPAPAPAAAASAPAAAASAPASPAAPEPAPSLAGEPLAPAIVAPSIVALPPVAAFIGPVASAPTPVATAASAPAQPAFEWPPSTRLSYRLTGHARGPVEGQARVEWLRQGSRYQVVMEASVGPAFAPLMTRRETSEGEITPEGLSPRHYEMEMKVVLRPARRTRIEMGADTVRLPAGETLPRPAGLQDAVSQFVHMTWLFTLQPALLTPGHSIDMPLALPRRVEPWTYDVVGTETLYTEAGVLEAVHVRPRRPARPGDFTAEMWVAPSLQNLPVRIKVRQDSENWIDLALERLPQQAAPATRPGS
ncbi:DUF3108 domain-containing protein [Rubrivivax rivuli]|uniref:DUF3108 domain-containing protein n=1 Tax=Rubrivivax rivuli TaxID=1862385 RepID=A0A437R9P7_9BURK|nr:DUF3108 domain-containing protein [Rubrivivax rivuli]RVU43417.1 DUF3108 domain-containing protein [Rubrivivax rivuli]